MRLGGVCVVVLCFGGCVGEEPAIVDRVMIGITDPSRIPCPDTIPAERTLALSTDYAAIYSAAYSLASLMNGFGDCPLPTINRIGAVLNDAMNSPRALGSPSFRPGMMVQMLAGDPVKQAVSQAYHWNYRCDWIQPPSFYDIPPVPDSHVITTFGDPMYGTGKSLILALKELDTLIRNDLAGAQRALQQQTVTAKLIPSGPVGGAVHSCVDKKDPPYSFPWMFRTETLMFHIWSLPTDPLRPQLMLCKNRGGRWCTASARNSGVSSAVTVTYLNPPNRDCVDPGGVCFADAWLTYASFGAQYAGLD